MEIRCPYCNGVIGEVCNIRGSGVHQRACCKKKFGKTKSTNERFLDFAKYNFGEEKTSKEWLEKQIEIEPIYVIDQNNFIRGVARKLCSIYGIKTKTLKEASNMPHKIESYKKTCMKKYGFENALSEGSLARKKRDKTMKEKYGVINFYSIEGYQDILKERQGLEEYHKRKQERSKQVWEAKTEEERQEWLDKSIFKRENWRSRVFGNSSKIEIFFSNFLQQKGFDYETQFRIFKNSDKNGRKHYFFYDYRIKDTNILIEFQGDYWHANPDLYKSTDLIKYPQGEVFAEDVWKKDKEKYLAAKNKGMLLIYVWESEFLGLDFENIFFEKLKEVKENGDYEIKVCEED